MEDKCPRCGAFLENGICPYCGYTASDTVQRNKDSINITELKPAEQQASDLPENPVPANTVAASNMIYAKTASSKSKVAALLLCLFLGIFGAHRFYVGKVLSGIVYLFTAGIAGFGIVYDLIMIITEHFTDSEGMSLRE